MLKLFNRKKKDNKGFTLVELVIVVAILAILVGLLAPQYTKYVERSRKAADASNLDNLVTAVKVAAADDAHKDILASDTAKSYVFVISDVGSKVYLDKEDQDANTAIGKALTEYAGDEWRNTTLKSSKWTEGTVDDLKVGSVQISAKCVIETNGSVTVSYYPTSVKNSVKEN